MPGHGERESGWRSFDSSRVGVPRRTPLWERATRELFMPLRIETPSGHVSGTIAGFRSGPIRTIRLDSTAHFGVRTPDLAEGADIVMVKPAGPHLDILAAVATHSPVPVAAYQISGEYSQIVAAAERGWIDRERVMMESLLGIRRAGAQIILSYFALEAAALL